MEDWIRVMREIEQVLDQLLVLSAEKRGVIVSGDVDRLEALTREETGLSAHLGNLESQRQRLVVVYCLQAGLSIRQATLLTIIPTLPEGPEKDALIAGRRALAEKTNQLALLNDINRQLLTTQMEVTQYMLEGVSHQATVGIQYGGNGMDADMHDEVRFLNRDV